MSSNLQGPVMIVATDVLKAPRARVGRLFGNVTLPRSVEVRTLAAGAVGTLVGLMIWLFPVGIPFRYSASSLIYTLMFSTALGVSTLYIQPFKGESLWRWVSLSVAASRERKESAGNVYVGLAKVGRVAAGPVDVLSGCADVRAGEVDERGVPSSKHFLDREARHEDMARQGFAPARKLR